MTEQQERLLVLLKEIDAICSKHDIEYYLAGGTLIGAIRHRGFLPWDDDADIYMTRSGWNRFVEACKEDLPEGRVLQAPDIDPSYTNTFPRYTTTDCVAVHSHQSLDKRFYGEVIDILILDPMNRDEDTYKRYTYDLMLYSDLLNYAAVFGRRFGVRAADYAIWKLKGLFLGHEYVRKSFENKLASYLDDSGELYVMRWGGNPLIFERSWFENSKRVPFEDINAMVPCGIDEYLIYHYGDEWYQVPTDVAAGGHDTAASLLVNPNNAHHACKSLIKRSMLPFLTIRKIIMLAKAGASYGKQNDRLNIEASLLANDIDSELRRDRSHVNECIERYIAWQCSARISGRDDWKGVYRFNHPIIAPVSDSFFEECVLRAFNTERIGRASRLIEISRVRDSRLLEQISNAIVQLREARSAFEVSDFESPLSLSEKVLSQFPENLTAWKIKLQAIYHIEGYSNCFLEALAHARTLFPEDGDLMLLEGDFAYSSGETERAIEFYREALPHTSNGLTLLQLSDRLHNVDGSAYHDAKVALAGQRHRESHGQTWNVQEQSKVYFRLFADVVSTLEKLGLKFFINPELAALLSTGVLGDDLLPAHRSAYELIMRGDQMQKLLDALRSGEDLLPSHIEWDSMGDSAYCPLTAVRFFDSRTADFSGRADYYSSNRGMSISISLMRQARYRKLAHVLLGAWRASCLCQKSYGKKSRILAKPLTYLPSSLRIPFGKAVHSLVLQGSERAQAGFEITSQGEKRRYPVELFAETGRLSFHGVSCPVPEDLAAYLEPLDVTAGTLGRLLAEDENRISLPNSPAKGTVLAQLGLSYYRKMYRRTLSDMWCAAVRKRFVRVFSDEKTVISFLDAFERRSDYLDDHGCFADGVLEEDIEQLDSLRKRVKKLLGRISLDSSQALFLQELENALNVHYERNMDEVNHEGV